ncbi:MAG: hypothetical protein RIR34_10 [Actinomycetota bacterium]
MGTNEPTPETKSNQFASAAATRLGIRVEGETAVFDGASLLASLGGWAGLIESTIPPTAFLVIYTISQNAVWSVSVSAALSLISILKQVIQSKPISQAIVGAALVTISAWLALRDHGSTKDYFIPGFITNISYGAVMLVSVLVRWPVIGLIVGFFKGWGFGWRKNRALLTRFDLVTSLWAILFGLRLLVELPLYFANNIEALGIAKLLMGYPLYAICLWFTWLSLRSVILTKS